MTSPLSLIGDDTARFLSALAGSGRLSFQTFDDTQAKQKRLAKVMHGSIDDHAKRLHQLNAQGAGVFVMVNEGDGRGRSTANVKAVRALFVDLDGAPLEPVLRAPIKPHIVVETSPGRWHAYWLVEDFPLSQFTNFQSQLAKMFDADPTVKDLPRVMRIPGFLHNKNGAQRSKLVSIRAGASITSDAIIKAFGINPIILVGARNEALFSASRAFKRAGIPKVGAHRRIAKVNAEKCDVPLGQDEITAIVDNAYGYNDDRFSIIPHVIVDAAEFCALSGTAVKLFLYAMRLHRPGNEFALPHSDYARMRGMANRQCYRAALDELLKAGLLVMTRDYIAGVESDKRLCALYRVADRVQVVPKKPSV